MFSIVLEKVVRCMETSPKGTYFNRTGQYIAGTDDVLVLGQSVRAKEELVTQIKEAKVSTGLVINENKTKYMKINRTVIILEQEMIMDGQVFNGLRSLDI
jgi:hypothetical protein